MTETLQATIWSQFPREVTTIHILINVLLFITENKHNNWATLHTVLQQKYLETIKQKTLKKTFITMDSLAISRGFN